MLSESEAHLPCTQVQVSCYSELKRGFFWSDKTLHCVQGDALGDSLWRGDLVVSFLEILLFVLAQRQILSSGV
jgi:hypothetical protein